ncbi:hypothetical protein E2C01_034676 [Portunus trituberculatus]|uniref:Uncharacterized protein n=1 Tax=Portunus trituberculatus TaxID=210409 RepID=A0A5B7F672_PORTR|nr:hypothetical protein [Portunus trituberculatus]
MTRHKKTRKMSRHEHSSRTAHLASPMKGVNGRNPEYVRGGWCEDVLLRLLDGGREGGKEGGQTHKYTLLTTIKGTSRPLTAELGRPWALSPLTGGDLRYDG